MKTQVKIASLHQPKSLNCLSAPLSILLCRSEQNAIVANTQLCAHSLSGFEVSVVDASILKHISTFAVSPAQASRHYTVRTLQSGHYATYLHRQTLAHSLLILHFSNIVRSQLCNVLLQSTVQCGCPDSRHGDDSFALLAPLFQKFSSLAKF